MSSTNITWPSTSSTRLFYRHHFYRFALLQGSVQVLTRAPRLKRLERFHGHMHQHLCLLIVLQLLQNYYWNKRNYTAVTLGKAKSMTVVPNLYGCAAAHHSHRHTTLSPYRLIQVAA